MSFIVERAAPGDDEGIRGLLRRQAMPGRIRIAFEREPSFAPGCAVTGDRYDVVVARDAGSREIVGVAVRSTRRVFVNGRPERMGYLGHLRVDQRCRGRWLVSRGLALVGEIDREDPVPAYFTSIVEGNDEAMAVVVRRRRAAFPPFREIARYRTLALPLRGPKPELGGVEELVPASSHQLPELVAFLRAHGARRQLFPVWTEDAITGLGELGLRIGNIRVARRGGTIVGVLGLWDQSAFKQSVVRGYSGWLRAAARLGGLVVPRIGARVHSAYAAMVCVADDDTRVFARLLRDVYNLAASSGFDYLVLGLDARDPLLAAAGAYRHFSYPSRLYLASKSDQSHLYENLDHRPVYVDVATL